VKGSRWVFLLQNFFIFLFVSLEVEALGSTRLTGERKFPIVSSMNNLPVLAGLVTHRLPLQGLVRQRLRL